MTETEKRNRRNVNKMSKAPIGKWIDLEPHGLQKRYQIRKLQDRIEVSINNNEVNEEVN